MWSPDGRYLAYRLLGWLSRDRRSSVDPDGHAPSRRSRATGWLVSWSPDSTRVATWVDLGKTIGIYGLDGVRQALLTVPPGCALPGDFDPVWSPDGMSVMSRPVRCPSTVARHGRVPATDPRSHSLGVLARRSSRRLRRLSRLGVARDRRSRRNPASSPGRSSNH